MSPRERAAAPFFWHASKGVSAVSLGRSWERLVREWRIMLRGYRRSSRSPFALLRRRLVATNVLVVAIVLVILSGGIYAFEAHTEGAQVDQQLASEAASEAAKETLVGGPPEIEPTEGPYRPQSPNVFSIVLGMPHRVVQDDDQVGRLGLPDWSSAQTVLNGKQPHVYATVERGATRLRLYTAPVRAHGRIVGAIQMGVSLAARDQQLGALLQVLVLLGGVVLLVTVVTSLWLSEHALRPAQAAYLRQRQFAAGASHELRTPLALIRSQAELITGHRCGSAPGAEERPGEAEEAEAEVADDAREIIAEVDYMSRLVGDLLVLARDDHDARAVEHRPLDLCALAADVAAKVRPLAEARGLRLVVDSQPRPGERAGVRIRGDEDRLRQLILILLDNAVRYTPGGGTVRVEVREARRWHPRGERAGWAYLMVSDTGVGIAPEHLHHIFEPFYRALAGKGQHKDEGSTGLGLALAQWIVQAHDGTITVKSAPGVGSTFTVALPPAVHA
jgi:signal transduction histidine kinase